MPVLAFVLLLSESVAHRLSAKSFWRNWHPTPEQPVSRIPAYDAGESFPFILFVGKADYVALSSLSCRMHENFAGDTMTRYDIPSLVRSMINDCYSSALYMQGPIVEDAVDEERIAIIDLLQEFSERWRI